MISKFSHQAHNKLCHTSDKDEDLKAARKKKTLYRKHDRRLLVRDYASQKTFTQHL